MLIGEVAARAGLPTSAIRFYEVRKLITRPARSAGGYRVYPERILDELDFIRRAKLLGLTLEEIGEILHVGRSGTGPCARVASICEGRLAGIERQMTELQTFRDQLEAVRRRALDKCGYSPEGFCNAIMAVEEREPS